MEQLLEQTMGFIQEVGFPVFVSFYLLHRLEVKLEAIHGALVTLKVK
ncbi:YvrJ family protein [Sporosarcina sp. ZBG7A]|nr:YvrJ protein family [Lysinibacillus sphaericus]